jgi:DNA primase
LSDYIINGMAQQFASNTVEGKSALLQALIPLLAKINAPTISLLLKQKCASHLGISTADINNLIEQKPNFVKPSRKISKKISSKPRVIKSQYLWILCLLKNHQLAHLVNFPDHLELDPYMECLASLAELIKRLEEPTWPQIRDAMQGLPHLKLLESLMQELQSNSHIIPEMPLLEDYFKDCLKQAEKRLYMEQFNILDVKYKQGILNQNEKNLFLLLIKNVK